MALVQSLEGALKLANHYRAPALAERISAFVATRLELEAARESLAEQEQQQQQVRL